MTNKLVIIGAGGHACVIADAVKAMITCGADIEILGYCAPQKGDMGPLNYPIIANDDDLPVLAKAKSATHFIIGFGSLRGGQGNRTRAFLMAKEAGLKPFNVVHPNACLSSDYTIGAGVFVAAGVVVNVGTTIADNVILNTRCSVDHDCKIGFGVHVAPGAVLCGDVDVEELVHIGAGATVLQGCKLEVGSTIGGGALVHKNVEAGITVLGRPATRRR